jgi:DNA-binding response OmpR family regulator
MAHSPDTLPSGVGADGAHANRPLILLLEDEPEEAGPTARALAFTGYRCVTARSQDRARAELARTDQTVALLVADLNLSAPAGLAFIQETRAIARYATLPIIITSGNSAPEAIMLARSLGQTDYLIKPFPLPDLIQSIQRWTQSKI